MAGGRRREIVTTTMHRGAVLGSLRFAHLALGISQVGDEVLQPSRLRGHAETLDTGVPVESGSGRPRRGLRCECSFCGADLVISSVVSVRTTASGSISKPRKRDAGQPAAARSRLVDEYIESPMVCTALCVA